MRKLILAAMFAALATGAFAQQQWKVVQTVELKSQTSDISPTTFFTPAHDSLCRLTVFFSSAGQPDSGSWTLHVSWKDFTGHNASSGSEVSAGAQGIGITQKEVILIPKAGDPVAYSVSGGTSTSDFNLALVIEQLQ